MHFVVVDLFFYFVWQFRPPQFRILHACSTERLDHKIIKFLLEVVCFFDIGFNIKIDGYLIL